ncbi:MAG: glycerol-3-phosphate 1-O-acyltransferase PlsY [Thermodesulfobacteriota bacterium]|nr:glycerol-3-phosphate 1-O-acyltransferase PlsY [Thermodesulfobacteriota bacterium]
MEDINFIYSIGIIVFAYLLGSIPFGLVFTRIFTSVDIRKQGSGNIGATNVRRVAGTPIGLLTLAGDVLKGVVPVYAATAISYPSPLIYEICVCLTALCAFLGHLYPVYMKFKTGGKGVATALGCFLVLSPVACLAALVAFLIVALSTNHVSAGSLAAAGVIPIAVWIKTNSLVMTACAAVITIFIAYRHQDNIKRLIAGTENVIRKKGK